MPPTPMHNINHRSDARPAAVATVRERIGHPDRVVFAFGTTHAMTVASGATRSLSLHAGDFSTSDALWAAVRSFVFEGEVRGRPVVGYLGYGLNDPAGVLMASDSPDLYLFIPEEIETVSHPVRPTASYRPVAAAASPAFVEQVRNVSRWIDGAAARRATIAREVTLPADTDLPGVLAAPVTCNRAGLYRSFYFRLPGSIEFAGNCPETLAVSTANSPREIVSHKLSGTFGRSAAARTDAAWLVSMVNDPKLDAEHEASVAGLARALSAVGDVRRVERRAVLELAGVRHFMTTLRTTLGAGRDRIDFVRRVLPTGATPFPEALPVIAEAEPFARGPYYGVCGIFHPSGAVELTQILRTVFKERDRCSLRVGCAITAGSTSLWRPEDEDRETRWKAGNVFLPTTSF